MSSYFLRTTVSPYDVTSFRHTTYNNLEKINGNCIWVKDFCIVLPSLTVFAWKKFNVAQAQLSKNHPTSTVVPNWPWKIATFFEILKAHQLANIFQARWFSESGRKWFSMHQCRYRHLLINQLKKLIPFHLISRGTQCYSAHYLDDFLLPLPLSGRHS